MKPNKKDVKEFLINNPSIFYDVLIEYDMYDGKCFIAFNDENGLNELFYGYIKEEVIDRISNGHYVQEDEYIKFDDDGNVKTFNHLHEEIDLDKVIEWLYDTNQDTDGAWNIINDSQLN